MARLPGPSRLLTAKAVASARLLDAELLVSTGSGLLEDVAASAGVVVRVVITD